MKVIVASFLLVISILITPYAVTDTLASSSDALIVHEPRVWLSKGGGLHDAYSIEQKPLFVFASIQNPSDETQEYMIVLEIRELSDGTTVFLELQSAITDRSEDELIYVPWNPEEAGEYQVRTFLISGLAHPEILSSLATSEISIYDDSFKGLVQMRKGACDGVCPAFTVEVYQNRTGIFEGYDYVANPGRYVFEVSNDQIDQLIGAFYDADFFALEDTYPPLGEGSPSIQFTINIDGTKKEVSHHYDKGSFPEQLIELENRIDEILGTNKWVFGEQASNSDAVKTTTVY